MMQSCLLFIGKKPKRSVLAGDSDDDSQPNTYDYNDSFIDDDDGGGIMILQHQGGTVLGPFYL